MQRRRLLKRIAAPRPWRPSGSAPNCRRLNSGLRKIQVLTQYKAQSLDRHIQLAWQKFFFREVGDFIDVVPPQQRIAEDWYQGTADAVYQNIYAIERERPEYVVILAGDHIYKMDYSRLVRFHIENKADMTVGALRVPRMDATSFGVMQIKPDGRIIGFQEKPADPRGISGDEGHALASMGIYVASASFLFEQLCQDVRANTVAAFGL